LTCKVLQVIQLTVDMPYMAGLSAGNSVDKPASLGWSKVTFPTYRIWQEFPSVEQINPKQPIANLHSNQDCASGVPANYLAFFSFV
jgi:hypothetical protein